MCKYFGVRFCKWKCILISLKVGVQAPEIIFGPFCPKSEGLTLVLSLSEPIIGGALALEVTTSLL